MKRHIQKTGVRDYHGDDFMELQSEPLKAIDAFFAPYPACIIAGCKITQNEDLTFNVSAGMVTLEAQDPGANPETEQLTKHIMPFGGAENVALPIYLVSEVTTVTRVYNDGKTKPVANNYIAVASGVEPDSEHIGAYIVVNENPVRFVDAVQDPTHQFITAEDRTKWNALQGAITTAISTLQTAINEGDTATLNAAKTDAQTKATAALNAAKTDAQTKATTALNSAKSYADTKVASGDTATLNAAKTDAQTKATAALNAAKSDAQTKATTAQTNAISSAKSYTNTKVAELVESSPDTLNTLNELAAALGDDPNFATTMTTALGLRATKTELAEAIAGIEVGGRNYVRNSAKQYRAGSWWWMGSMLTTVEIKTGDVFIVSWFVNPEHTNPTAFLSISTEYGSEQYNTITNIGTYTGQRSVVSFVAAKDYPTGSSVAFRAWDSDVTVINSISEIKLEKGSIATDWTPAPEDIQAVATTTANGLMTKEDKTKLNNISPAKDYYGSVDVNGYLTNTNFPFSTLGRQGGRYTLSHDFGHNRYVATATPVQPISGGSSLNNSVCIDDKVAGSCVFAVNNTPDGSNEVGGFDFIIKLLP